VVATVLQWLEIEAGFSVEGLKGQLLAQHPVKGTDLFSS
jgi:hypothetical protein